MKTTSPTTGTARATTATDMASVKRERISDERLRKVTDFVHDWLFGTDEGTRKNASGSRQAQAPKRRSPKAKSRA
jgi:hypothetical protein